jgi:hypothetical protein
LGNWVLVALPSSPWHAAQLLASCLPCAIWASRLGRHDHRHGGLRRVLASQRRTGQPDAQQGGESGKNAPLWATLFGDEWAHTFLVWRR